MPGDICTKEDESGSLGKAANTTNNDAVKCKHLPLVSVGSNRSAFDHLPGRVGLILEADLMWIFCQILWKTYTPVLTECRSFPPLERKESFDALKSLGYRTRLPSASLKVSTSSKIDIFLRETLLVLLLLYTPNK